MAKRKHGGYLTTLERYELNMAVAPIVRTFDSYPYLVGSSNECSEYRDVDVRMILSDEEFDALFHERKALWSLLCSLISAHLRTVTGLPIDFQIQRMTEANEKHQGSRFALGIEKFFAGGGDATRFEPEQNQSEED